MNYTIALIIMIIGGAVCGYLSGSILFAVIFSNCFKKTDVRTSGSNNPGFTNSTRLYGKKIGILVLGFDTLKTIIPIVIFFLIYQLALRPYMIPFKTNTYDPAIFIYTPGIFAIVGHIFPIYFKFKGGKGISCYGGLCLCLSPFIALIGIIIIFLAVKLYKKVSIGSLAGALLIPFLSLVPGINYFYMMYPNISICVQVAIHQTIIFVPIFVGLIILSCLVIYRHKNNIRNLLNKQEQPITKSTSGK